MSNVIPFPKRPSPKRPCQEHLHRIRERVEQRLGEKLALMAAAGDPGTISLINRLPNMKELVDAYYRAHRDGGPDAA